MVTPDGLTELVASYEGQAQTSVRFRSPTWRRVLAAVPGDPTALLDSDLTRETQTPKYRSRGDRLVDRSDVERAFEALDLDGPDDKIVQAFVLMMAWGSGVSNGRAFRYTAMALSDPTKAAGTLRGTARALRAMDALDEPELRRIYKDWHLPGIGSSFFTKWFAFAGAVPGRAWQPLILDQRVVGTLNKSLHVYLRALTTGRGSAARYAAYLRVMHEWAGELSISAERLEWVLFAYNGQALPQPFNVTTSVVGLEGDT